MTGTNQTSLEGQVAVITGGHSGIGFYLSQALLAAGMKVAILARRAGVLQGSLERVSPMGLRWGARVGWPQSPTCEGANSVSGRSLAL